MVLVLDYLKLMDLQMEYKFKIGARVPRKLDANDTANELERIRNKYGLLQPELVVAESRKENSILHNAFEWDNTKAAEQYRVSQARYLIRVVVKVEDNNTEHKQYYSIKTEDNTSQFLPASLVVQEISLYESAKNHLKQKVKGLMKSISELDRLAEGKDKRKIKRISTALQKVGAMVEGI